jgi:hypothetical protein
MHPRHFSIMLSQEILTVMETTKYLGCSKFIFSLFGHIFSTNPRGDMSRVDKKVFVFMRLGDEQ